MISITPSQHSNGFSILNPIPFVVGFSIFLILIPWFTPFKFSFQSIFSNFVVNLDGLSQLLFSAFLFLVCIWRFNQINFRTLKSFPHFYVQVSNLLTRFTFLSFVVCFECFVICVDSPLQVLFKSNQIYFLPPWI